MQELAEIENWHVRLFVRVKNHGRSQLWEKPEVIVWVIIVVNILQSFLSEPFLYNRLQPPLSKSL